MNELEEALTDRMQAAMDASPYKPAAPGSPLARARMRAHQTFDRFWGPGKMTRKQAYRWLARMMGIPVERCHILMFSEGDCEEVIKICTRRALREAGNDPS